MVVLNSLDGLLTAYCISKDIANEMNPFMGFLLDHGIWLFLLVKLVPANLFIWWAATHKRPVMRFIVNVGALFFLYLVIGQTLIILEAYVRDIL